MVAIFLLSRPQTSPSRATMPGLNLTDPLREIMPFIWSSVMVPLSTSLVRASLMASVTGPKISSTSTLGSKLKTSWR